MGAGHSDELVFTVAGTHATPLESIDIAKLKFLERQHLQEWVLRHPEILGKDVMIVTFEFDRWSTPNGVNPKNRLDVLGIDRDGQLVVAELKRGRAPDTVDLQSIGYAAMASRFTEELLIEFHMEFLNRDQAKDAHVTEAEASISLNQHVLNGISTEVLLSPKIVIVAEEYSVTVTSSVMWLTEQGLDITLKKYKAYRTTSGETILTVSQFYPVPDLEAFQVAPLSKIGKTNQVQLPEVPWSTENFVQMISLPFEVPQAVMDLCSERPSEWIGSSEVYERAGVETKSGTAKLAGFGYSVRTRFERSNPPWKMDWGHGSVNQQYYSVGADIANIWKELRTAGSASNSD